MDKKPYTPPTITEHGDAVKETKGFGGHIWEALSPRQTSDIKFEW